MHKLLSIFVIFLIFFPIYTNNSLFLFEINENIENLPNVPKTENSLDIIDNSETARAGLNKLNQQGDSGKFFTENLGQVNNDNVKYYIQGHGIWFTESSVVFEIVEPKEIELPEFNNFKSPMGVPFDKIKTDVERESAVVQFDFMNSNDVIPIGKDDLPHKSNFFYGNDSSKWYTDVLNYREIFYKNIYDNIDLKYYLNENGLKYDFIVRPGGDPNDIIIKVKGARELSRGTSGDIKIKTDVSDIIDKNPFVYQKHDEKAIEVPAEFKLIDSNSYGFRITGDYNKHMTLVIDPLIFSTYLGGKNDDSAEDIEVDEYNNVFITGWTDSSDFPVKSGSNDTTHNGNKDIFVVKLNAQGTSLLYSTFIGGNGYDIASAIAIDSNGNSYITGHTGSDDFPTTPNANDTTYNGGLNDGFVCKLNSMGNVLNYSTYIGGSGNEYFMDIVIDDQNNAYTTGGAQSSDFPTTPGAYKSTHSSDYGDVFVTIVDNSGSHILHSTFISGIGNNVDDWSIAYSIALDNKNYIYITGRTESSDYPTTPGTYNEKFVSSFEVFISKLNANLSTLLYSTFTGAKWSGGLFPQNILIDSENNIILLISAWSLFTTTDNAYDTTWNGQADVGICKFDPTLSTLLYATFLGGKKSEFVYDSLIDDKGNIYLVGVTNSSDFPVTEYAYDKSYNGIWDWDIFITKLDINNSRLVYSSYIGTPIDDLGKGIALNDKRIITIAGQTGAGFPTTAGSFDTIFNGGLDAFVLKLQMISPAQILDLNISENIVYRPNIIELYSNVSDYEDPENALTPHFEYLSPDQPGWQTDLLRAPVYINDRWQTQFSISTKTNLGFYNFRVRFNDTDGIWTRWFYLNGSLLVLNNPPQIEYFNISKHSVVIGKKLELIFNATDVEDIMNKLNPEVEYKPSSEPFWDPLEPYKLEYMGVKWEFTFSIPPVKPYGYYDFRVRVNDTDDDYSGWSYLNKSLFVRPAPPEIISITLSKPEIYRTEQLEVYVNCSDLDTLPEDIYVELQYMSLIEGNWHNASAVYYGKLWEANLNSKRTWALGIYNFRARATDWEENESPWFYLNDSLIVLNNIPEIIDISNIPEKMLRKQSKIITLNASDKENFEKELEIELEYKLTGSDNWNIDHLSEPVYVNNYWQFELTQPLNAPLGTYSFRARVQDLDNDWSAYLYLNDSLLVTNHAPVVISFDQTPAEVYRTETVMITSDGSDIETPKEELECNIYYLAPNSIDWQKINVNYNNTTNKWHSDLITTKSITLGNYSFKVEFTDAEGFLSKPVYANRSVWVRNNLPVISGELDNIQVGSTQIIIKLADYGYDIETSKSNLKWKLESSSVDTSLCYIDDESISKQELAIYPIRSKQGQDDITIILIDSDNGRITKTDITIVVDSRAEGEAIPPDEDSPMKKIVGSMIWLYVLIIITVVVIIFIFIFYRRKKKHKEEEMQKEKEEAEKALEASREEALPVAAETVALPPAEPASEPAPTLEPSPEPAPVPMPAPAEQPQLPVATAPEPVAVPAEPVTSAAPAAETPTSEPTEVAEEPKKEGTVESKSESEDEN